MRTLKLLLATMAFGLNLASCNGTNFKGTSSKLHPTISKEFTQDDYPAATSTHIQGHQGDPGVQDFQQGTWGPLDVVVVIDNSGSMAEEQANLSTKLETLLSQVDKADWRISVVTTTPKDGCQWALINKTDANAKAHFQSAITLAGTGGDFLERPFLQAVNALK